jgi:DNA-binding transcriptional LysR family regulator
MHVTLRQLQIFEAVVRNAGISAAARELHCTQPSVSIQLKQLVEQVGVPLFEGNARSSRLTEAGQALYTTCQLMSQAWDNFEAYINDLNGLKRGRLRLGVVSTAKYFIPRLLGPFCKRYPGIDVRIEVSNRERIVERLREGLDDLTFMSRPPHDMPLHIRPFLDNPLVLIAPEDHELARRGGMIELEELSGERILLRERGSGTRMAIDEFLNSRGIELAVRMEIGSNEAIKQAVRGGLGLSIISRHAMRDSKGIVELPCAGMPIASTWHIVTPADRPLTVVAKHFIEYLLEEGLGELRAEA